MTRRREGISPSLFPFLAVLVCTLGTLILLLALVAQNATAAAEQRAQAEQVSKDPPVAQPNRLTQQVVQSLLDEEQFRLEQLVSFRDQQTIELQDRKDHIAHIDATIERLRQQLQQFITEAEQAMSESALDPVDQNELELVKAQIRQQQKTLETLRDELKNAAPRVVIVPHQGPNGTARRPVYLECTAEGITIWPENTLITLDQLNQSTRSANPLDAALRVARLYALRNYGDTVAPYPLLVVRPDGIETYAAARNAMQDWDDQFGYELVPADMKLAFTKPDPKLKRQLRVAIDDAIARQRPFGSSALAYRGSSGSRPGFSNNAGSANAYARSPDSDAADAFVDTAAGNATTSDRFSGNQTSGDPRGNAPPRPLPTLSAAELDRQGRQNGFGTLRDFNRARPPTASSPSGSYRSGQSHRSGQSYTRGGYGGFTPGANGFAQPDANGDARRARQLANEMREAASELRQQTGSGLAPEPPSLSHQSGSQQGTDGGEFVQTDSGVADVASDVNPRKNSNNDAAKRQSIADMTKDPTLDKSATERTQRPLSAGQPAQKSSSNHPSTTSRSMSLESPHNRSSDATTASSDHVSSSAPSQAASGEQQQPPSPFSASARPPVTRQGRDWALPPTIAGMGGNAIVRSIRVECFPDRFELTPSKQNAGTQRYPILENDIDETVIRLATALRDRVERWGPALPGGRWQPRLEVFVHPGAEGRFHQLRTLMNGSGFEIIGNANGGGNRK